MKKLLATSALISTVALSSVSFAQTTVTGSLDLTYRSTTGGTGQGDTFMGRETQVNLANKGKLSNGLDYAAGFSLEFDGMQTRAGTATTSVDNEAVYLNLISGGTTVTVGLDWIQNSKNDLIGSVGDVIDEVGTVTPGGKTLLLNNSYNDILSKYLELLKIVKTIKIGFLTSNYSSNFFNYSLFLPFYNFFTQFYIYYFITKLYIYNLNKKYNLIIATFNIKSRLICNT
jgi:hypothetical protein